MRHKILSLFALVVCSYLSAQHTYDLTLNISNIKSKNGFLEIGLFNKEKGFLKEGNQFLRKKIKVSGLNSKITLSNLPKGDYAIAVYHDANNNNICDTNLIGIPTEAYGFSNNFKPKLSAPKFSQTKFLMDRNKDIHISLIN